MASTDNLKNDLEEIQDARDSIKSALNTNGANVGDDIRTFATGVNAVASVKTVNNISADNNKNVTITAEDIVIKDSESEFYNNTVSSAVNDLVEGMGNLGSSLYSITIAETTTTSGYAKTYTLKVDNEEVGVKINIPKDLVVNKGEVKTVTTVDTPYTGAKVGDKYIDLELNDSTQNHIYIPVKDLVDVYTGVDGTKITVSINGTNQISATIKAGTIELTDLVSTLQTKINKIPSTGTIATTDDIPNIGNIVNGSATGSVRTVGSAEEVSGTYTIGQHAFAEGSGTKAKSSYTHAEGYNTTAYGTASHAEGYNTSTTHNYSHAEGLGTIAGKVAHAEGSTTSATGDYSHSEGDHTKASSSAQHAQGKYNIDDTASKYAHIVGNGTNSSNRSNAHTIDWNGLGWFAGGLKVGGTGQDDATAKTVATTYDVESKQDKFVIIPETVLNLTSESTSDEIIEAFDEEDRITEIIEAAISGKPALLHGRPVIMAGMSNTDIKRLTLQIYTSSTAIRNIVILYYLSIGEYSCRLSNTALADTSSVPNNSNIKNGSKTGSLRTINSATENTNYTMGQNAFVEGYGTRASGNYSHAEGRGTAASGSASHAEGLSVIAFGSNGSHAEGYCTVAYGTGSHAEGGNAIHSMNLTGDANATSYTYSNPSTTHSLAIDDLVSLNGKMAKITSVNTSTSTITVSSTLSSTALSNVGVSVYYGGIAYGGYSHIEGFSTTTLGNYSHAEGNGTTASGGCSHSEGLCTAASGKYQHVQGKYNIEDTNNKYAHIVGNGTDDNSKSNAHTLDWNGNGWFAGDVKVGGTSQDDSNAYTLISSDTLVDYQYRKNGVLNQNDISDYITKKIDSSNTGVASVEYGGQPRK